MDRVLRLASILAVILILAIPVFPVLAEPVDGVTSYSGHWIDVDLTTLQITAFEGATPLYKAAITSGKPGYETPTGVFHIYSRVASETMSSETLGVPRNAPEGYYLEDVRYVQYFASDGIALHTNYWAPDDIFGKTNVSHGCVSMRQTDAAVFWNFATWGTPIVIHRMENKTVSPELKPVPAVVGMPLNSAADKLNAEGLQVQANEDWSATVARGLVISQTPAANEQVVKGTVVQVVVSKGPKAFAIPPQNGVATVPNVIGISEAEARDLIDKSGLRTSYVNYQSEDVIDPANLAYFKSIPVGCVVSMIPAPGQQFPVGTEIKLAVRR